MKKALAVGSQSVDKRVKKAVWYQQTCLLDSKSGCYNENTAKVNTDIKAAQRLFSEWTSLVYLKQNKWNQNLPAEIVNMDLDVQRRLELFYL